ncbi:MAG: PAS domain-containing protein [Alphaproteobacteria bacterium]|nr:PAS domain-containing protein [Alphaproteobacteria bacterium]
MPKLQSRKKAGRRAFEANILDGLTDAVILIDENRIIVDVNAAAIDLLGTDAKGLGLGRVINNAQVIKAVDTVLTGGNGDQGEVLLPPPVSRNCEMRVIALPARNPTKANWIMLVLRDVTDARKTEQMRTDFISNVSHELRSPVSSLLGFIETLQGPAHDDADARDRFLGIMADEARRMTSLVNDLLTLSRVEADEHIRPAGPVNIAGVLAEISTVLMARARMRGMTIDLRIPDDLPQVTGDKEELIQVFRNLIDNAISYGSENTSIQVVAENQGQVFGTPEAMLAVSVTNQGAGINPQDIERLTERFYRVDKGRSRATGGTGLGLAIVKHIIGHHRGNLEIRSTPGENTSFTVCLPIPK